MEFKESGTLLGRFWRGFLGSSKWKGAQEGEKGDWQHALRTEGERKDFSWLSMRRKRIGVHRSLGGFGEKEPISLEAEQYFSKAGSSRYSYMKLTSSHLYLILHCFSFFCKSRYYLVDWCGRKGPQIVLLRLVANLFAQNLFVIFSTTPSPLKDHEMWLYLISIMPVCYLLVFSVLHYTFFYPSS